MADDLSKKGVPDSKRVSLKQDWEVTYWCAEFGCTNMELEKAVKKVGDSVAAVKEELGKK